LTLAAGQAAEIEIPVPAAESFGVTFMASASVSATLIDEKGAVRGRSAAGTPEAAGFFRTIYVDKGLTAGTWKLRLENTGKAQSPAIIAAWSTATAKKF
jgi:hypothetical protein